MANLTAVPASAPVIYPSIEVGGVTYQLRYTTTARFLMQSWGFDLRKASDLVWAAAMAGFDNGGIWRSAGFLTPVDFTDKIPLDQDMTAISNAVVEALKKAAPQATVTLEAPPATASENAA